MSISLTSILAERMRRQRLTEPLTAPEKYVALFRTGSGEICCCGRSGLRGVYFNTSSGPLVRLVSGEHLVGRAEVVDRARPLLRRQLTRDAAGEAEVDQPPDHPAINGPGDTCPTPRRDAVLAAIPQLSTIFSNYCPCRIPTYPRYCHLHGE